MCVRTPKRTWRWWRFWFDWWPKSSPSSRFCGWRRRQSGTCRGKWTLRWMGGIRSARLGTSASSPSWRCAQQSSGRTARNFIAFQTEMKNKMGRKAGYSLIQKCFFKLSVVSVTIVIYLQSNRSRNASFVSISVRGKDTVNFYNQIPKSWIPMLTFHRIIPSQGQVASNNVLFSSDSGRVLGAVHKSRPHHGVHGRRKSRWPPVLRRSWYFCHWGESSKQNFSLRLESMRRRDVWKQQFELERNYICRI